MSRDLKLCLSGVWIVGELLIGVGEYGWFHVVYVIDLRFICLWICFLVE